MKKSRLFRVIISFSLTVIVMAILVLIASTSDEPSRIITMMGGVMPAGLIQGATYFLFLFGMSELMSIRSRLTTENDAFSTHPLPQQENYVMSVDDVGELKLKLQHHYGADRFMLIDLITQVCMKYRLSHSSSEALDLVEEQVNLYNSEVESEQSFVRYVAWAIPSVGFIGTVLGIAASLGYANEATTPEGIKKVTDSLSIAFDTTLVALVLSVILMFYMNYVQKMQDDLFCKMKDYVVSNLINRLYK